MDGTDAIAPIIYILVHFILSILVFINFNTHKSDRKPIDVTTLIFAILSFIPTAVFVLIFIMAALTGGR